MLEVCFNNSAWGALHQAQHIAQRNSIGFIFGGELSPAQQQELQAQFRQREQALAKIAVPLGGSSQDLIGLSLLLSMGDIAAPPVLEDCPRKEFLRRQFTFNPRSASDDAGSEADSFWQRCIDDLERLRIRAATGEPVRIWADDTPDGACGLRFAAKLLDGLDTAVSVVPLPRHWDSPLEPGRTVIRFSGWGEVEPAYFGLIAAREERPLSPTILHTLAMEWTCLKEENAPLRALVNGKPVSVEESFYDPFLRRAFAVLPCKAAVLIGTFLGRCPLGIGDWLAAQRIFHMLDTGELRMVEKSPEGFYASVIDLGIPADRS